MKQYMIGGIVGFLAFPLVWGVFSAIPSTKVATSLIPPASQDNPEYYKQAGKDYLTDYKLEAAFIDDDSSIQHGRSFGIFREEPVHEFLRGDIKNACVRSFDNESFDVAFTLQPDVRQKLISNLQESDERFRDHATEDGFERRYYIEAHSDMIEWFWITKDGAEAYKKAVHSNPDKPDFVLTVPLHQLDRFQLYLANSLDTPLLAGCSPLVDVTKIPGWKEVVLTSP